MEKLVKNNPEKINHLLSVSNLHVHYGKTCALKDISFDIKCGFSLAVMGANGAGKSTLLKSLAGLLKPTEGKMIWRDKPLIKSSYEIAYLPQREEVDWNFPITVRGLVEMGRYPHLGLFKKFSKEDKNIVDEAINEMGLQNLGQRKLRQLSGGQQQRAFIARALAQEAHVLLLDEPFNSLDQGNQKNLVSLFNKLTNACCLIIVSCHDSKIVNDSFDFILKLERNIISFKNNKNKKNND